MRRRAVVVSSVLRANRVRVGSGREGWLRRVRATLWAKRGSFVACAPLAAGGRCRGCASGEEESGRSWRSGRR